MNHSTDKKTTGEIIREENVDTGRVTAVYDADEHPDEELVVTRPDVE